MRVTSIKARNFKSFDIEGINFKLNNGLNLIAGENNSGKSNIIRVFQAIRQVIINEQTPQTNDYHNQNSILIIEMGFALDDDDIKILMEDMQIPLLLKADFIKIFGTDLRISVESSLYAGAKLTFRFGDMILADQRGWQSNTDFKGGYRTVSWRGLVSDSMDGEISLYEAVEKHLKSTESAPYCIEFHDRVRKFFIRLFMTKIIVFPEFRERPTKSASGTLFSPDGKELAGVLFNLKNGDIYKRERFEKIQGYFSKIFPNLRLDVRQGYEIVVVKVNKQESPQESIGAGIVEIVNLLTHLIDYEGHTFMMDEPELHLHPHAKRLVANLIREYSSHNQIICITHSTRFLYLEEVENITLVRDANGATELFRLPDKYMGKEEISKLLRIIDTDQKEFLFARAALLVEGDTEFGALPRLSQKLGADFDYHGISLINVGGHHFSLFVNLLKGFQIPYLVLCDRDVLETIEESIVIGSTQFRVSSAIKQLHALGELDEADLQIIKECKDHILTKRNSKEREVYQYNNLAFQKLLYVALKHNFIVLSSDFEGIFENAGNGGILNDARKLFGKSKVLQGKYLAEMVTEIPSEIITIIRKITSS